MKRLPDLTGSKCGNWEVISYAGKRGRRELWKCKCACGKKQTVLGQNLRTGHTKRCNECRKNAVWKHGHSKNPKAGEHVTPTYGTWLAMKKRCHSPGDSRYPYYGARGITVCWRWRNNFSNFLKDMGERPIDKTLERKNRHRGYSPSNCIWASVEVQANNRSNNHRITVGRETKTIAQWCRTTGISYACAFARLQRGVKPALAFQP